MSMPDGSPTVSTRGVRLGPVPSSSFLEILWVKFKMKTNSTLQLYNLMSCKWAEKSGLCHSKIAMFIIVKEGNPSLLHSETRIGTIVLLPRPMNITTTSNVMCIVHTALGAATLPMDSPFIMMLC